MTSVCQSSEPKDLSIFLSLDGFKLCSEEKQPSAESFHPQKLCYEVSSNFSLFLRNIIFIMFLCSLVVHASTELEYILANK